MNNLNVDLSRYAAAQTEYDAFDALVEAAQEAIAEETARLYRQMYDGKGDLSAEAQQRIQEFAYKKAFFCVVRDKQEECMNHEYQWFIKAMQREFEQRAKDAGLSVEELEDLELDATE